MAVLVSALIMSLLGEPIWAANLPTRRPSKDPSLGIVRTGQPHSPSDERAYTLMEKRVERWLDSSKQLKVRTQSLRGSLGEQQRTLTREQMRLSHACDQLVEALDREDSAGRKAARQKLTQMKQLRETLFSISTMGPTLQKAYLSEAAYYWRYGKQLQAKKSIRQAVRLHPNGNVEHIPLWDWDEGGLGSLSFEREIGKVASAEKRMCTVSLSVFPPNANVSFNGFNIGNKRRFRLMAGSSYYVQSSIAGYESAARRVNCRKFGVRHVRLELRELKGLSKLDENSLAQVSQRHETGSLLLIDSEQDRFKFYLYTPGKALDEIPLQKPVRIAEVLQNPTEAPVPIATDAFRSLYQSHQTAVAMNSFRALDGTPLDSLSAEVKPTKWYNNWKFWAITGGIIGGVAIAYLATKKSRVGDQVGGLRIRID